MTDLTNFLEYFSLHCRIYPIFCLNYRNIKLKLFFQKQIVESFPPFFVPPLCPREGGIVLLFLPPLGHLYDKKGEKEVRVDIGGGTEKKEKGGYPVSHEGGYKGPPQSSAHSSS